MAEQLVQRTAVVDAPVENVWAVVDDVKRLPEWFAFADAAELLDGSGVGRHQRIYGHWGKKKSEVDQRVVEYEPPHRLAWVHDAERLAGKPAPQFARETRFTIALEADGDRTRITLRSVQVPASALKGFVMRLFGTREVAKNLDESLRRLPLLLVNNP